MKNDSRNGKNRRRNSNRIHWKYSNGRHEDVYANFEGEKVKASVADLDGDGVQVSVECKEKGKEIFRYWFCLPDGLQERQELQNQQGKSRCADYDFY